ncbi:hypothetical protein EDD11_000017 [Mortierella claussenii]|nr:hypothetical protein EDD11_000017 [Mortierella claussenii]
MLKRRSTIHPSPQSYPAYSHKNFFAATDGLFIKPSIIPATNPFRISSSSSSSSSSSRGDLIKSALEKQQHQYYQQLPPKYPPKQQKHKRHLNTATAGSGATINTTNPFLYQPIAYSANSKINSDSVGSLDIWDNTNGAFDEDVHSSDAAAIQDKREGSLGGTHRLSSDVFKSPFGRHLHHRATCASSGLKRAVTVGDDQQNDFTYLEQEEEILRSSFTALDQQPLLQTQQRHGSQEAMDDGPDVILKTSRYDPDELEHLQSHSYSDPYLESHDTKRAYHGGSGNYDQGRSLNLFLTSEYDSELTAFTNARPEKPKPKEEGEYGLERYQEELYSHETPQPTAKTCERSNAQSSYSVRRYHSDFSDWSIEDCPRLLAFQKKQQEEQDARLLRQSDLSSSQMPMIRSRTDTVLDRYQDQNIGNSALLQGRRYAPACRRPHNALPPPAPSSFANRQRRNTVVMTRNTIRQTSESRPLYDNTHQQEQQPISRAQSLYQCSRRNISRDEHELDEKHDENQDDHSAAVGDDSRLQPSSYRASKDVSAPPHRSQESLSATSLAVAPDYRFDRSTSTRPCAQRNNIVRREPQSYAHDFMNNNDRLMPSSRPWSSTNSNSSSNSSSRSPLYQATFPHEREEYQEPELVAHHDIKVAQMRPYGQEEDDEELEEHQEHQDGKYGDEDALQSYGPYNRDVHQCSDGNEKGVDSQDSVHEFGVQLDHGNETCRGDDENDDRYRYNSADRQQPVQDDDDDDDDDNDDEMITTSSHHPLQGQAATKTNKSFTGRLWRSDTSIQGRPRELLTRKATLAKAKFYKLIKQSQHSRDRSSSSSSSSAGYKTLENHSRHLRQSSDTYLKQEMEDNEEGIDGHGLGDRSDISLQHDLQDDDLSRSETSIYSVTSSLRARVRLNSRDKTVLRQVKCRLSTVTRTMISKANKAANNMILEANRAANTVAMSSVLRDPSKQGTSRHPFGTRMARPDQDQVVPAVPARLMASYQELCDEHYHGQEGDYNAVDFRQ